MWIPRPAVAEDEVTFEPWSPALWAQIVVGATVVGLLGGLAWNLFVNRGPLASEEYHLWRWQADTVVGAAFKLAGIGPNPEGEARNEALQAYFGLTSRLRREEEQPEPDAALIETLTNERAAYENDVERIVEGFVADAVREAGLQHRLPLFDGVSIAWPPVEIELTNPPQLLVRSPRDRIKRDGDTLLKNDLTLSQIEDIEARTENDETAALVVSIGGIAAYPAIVRDDRSYDSLLETTAHEWVHHYLAFYPLGQRWGSGGDAEALNETTANIAGRELAVIARRLHPVELPEDGDGRAPARPGSTIDFTADMRALRLDVDRLLAEGKIAEAEQLMEERRLYFWENGIFIRKINQAYFAFYGTYADTPASSNPIGPKIERVWDLTGDVGVFLKGMREVETAGELDELLGRLEAVGR
jgi:hypothetical protein